MFMGGHVVETIRSGISSSKCFVNDPGLLMYGCLCVIFSVAVWLVLASYLEMPVSTTHSCVGGMIGMTMVARGSKCVIWIAESTEFPYVKGVVAIIVSWFLSPVVSAGFSFVFFWLLRLAVLRSPNSYSRARLAFPILLACTLIINIFFIVYKGATFLKLDNTPLSTAFAISFGIGGGVGIISYFVAVPYILRTTEALYEKRQIEKAERGTKKEAEVVRQPRELPTGVFGAPARLYYAIVDHLTYSMEHKAEDIIDEDPVVQAIHDNAEKFDEKTELTLRYLQILTACCDSFAHGANDVANSIGPFATIVTTYKLGKVSTAKKTDMGNDSYWILGLGAAGIVVGLSFYGYKILHALGTKICKLTPSRGICIELGAACVIIMGTRLGWPLSTTHCQVGSTIGVAMFEGVKGINWYIFFKTIIGWVITLAVVASCTALLFAQGAFAPMQSYPCYITGSFAKCEQ